MLRTTLALSLVILGLAFIVHDATTIPEPAPGVTFTLLDRYVGFVIGVPLLATGLALAPWRRHAKK